MTLVYLENTIIGRIRPCWHCGMNTHYNQPNVAEANTKSFASVSKYDLKNLYHYRAMLDRRLKISIEQVIYLNAIKTQRRNVQLHSDFSKAINQVISNDLVTIDFDENRIMRYQSTIQQMMKVSISCIVNLINAAVENFSSQMTVMRFLQCQRVLLQY